MACHALPKCATLYTTTDHTQCNHHSHSYHPHTCATHVGYLCCNNATGKHADTPVTNYTPGESGNEDTGLQLTNTIKELIAKSVSDVTQLCNDKFLTLNTTITAEIKSQGQKIYEIIKN
jgi:hypothetical protein